MPTQDTEGAAPGNQDGTTPAWYRELPLWARVTTQISFAALIAVLFGLDSRERAAQLREFQTNVWSQAKEDRQWFREELKTQRENNERRTSLMVDQLQVLTRAVETNTRQIEIEFEKWAERRKFGDAAVVPMAPAPKKMSGNED